MHQNYYISLFGSGKGPHQKTICQIIASHGREAGNTFGPIVPFGIALMEELPSLQEARHSKGMMTMQAEGRLSLRELFLVDWCVRFGAIWSLLAIFSCWIDIITLIFPLARFFHRPISSVLDINKSFRGRPLQLFWDTVTFIWAIQLDTHILYTNNKACLTQNRTPRLIQRRSMPL